MPDEVKTPEIVVESTVKINQEFSAEGLLKNEIEIRGWEYDQAIKGKQQELAKAEAESNKLNEKLDAEVTRAATEHCKADVEAIKALLIRLGMEKHPTVHVNASLDNDGEKISYNLQFSHTNCHGFGSLPATVEAKSAKSAAGAGKAEVKKLQEAINELRLAKENDILQMKIIANKSVRQMASRNKAGLALIKDLVEAVRPALPAPKK